MPRGGFKRGGSRGGSRGGGGSRGRGGGGRGGGIKRRRVEKEEAVKGVKKRHLERVDNYEYSLPENFDDEDIDAKETGGYDEWDNRSDGEYDSDLSAASGDESELITLSELWDQNEQESEDERREKEEEEEEMDEIDETHSELVDNIKSIAQTNELKTRKQMEIVDKRVESEHNIHMSALEGDSETSSLSLPDLISHLSAESSKKLQASVKEHSVKTRDLLLQAPMHRIDQERLTREAAYAQDKAQLTQKWESTVRDNRTADISFPALLEERVVRKTDTIIESFNPTNEFEKELAGLLHSSGQSTNTKNSKPDELPLNQLDPVQMAMRTAELRRMKAMISYEVQKATRVKKIHSKTYRRIHKKADKAKEDKLMMEYLATNPEAAAEELQKMEMARIQERMSLKHKNTSKWVKENLKRGKHIDPVSRQAIEEQMARGRDLTKKMASMNDDEEEEDKEDDNEFINTNNTESDLDLEDPEMRPTMTEDENRRRRIAALTRDPNAQVPTTGLYAIKFMKRAMDRSLDEAERRLNNVDDYEEGEEEERQKSEENAIVGRKVIGSKDAKPTIIASSKPTATISGELVPQVSVGHKARVAGPISASKSENVAKVVVSREQTNEAASILNQTQYTDKPQGKNQKKREEKERKMQMRANAKSEPKEAAPVDSNPWMQESDMPVETGDSNDTEMHTDNNGQENLEIARDDSDDTDMIDSKEENDEDEQTKLLRRAFAADNVVEEFIRENDKTQAKKHIPSGLTTPGWGSWHSEFVQPTRTPKKQTPKIISIKTEAPTTPTTINTKKSTNTPEKSNTNTNKKPNTPKANQPASNKRVVGKSVQMKTITKKKEAPIFKNEDKTKLAVANKYQVRNLPYGVQSAEEFKKTMNTPIGREWVPSLAHTAAIKPRVTTKAGLAITPIEMSSEQEKKYKDKASNYVKKYHKAK